MTKKSRLLELGRLWGIYSRTRCLPVEKEVGTVITWWQLLVVNVNKKKRRCYKKTTGAAAIGRLCNDRDTQRGRGGGILSIVLNRY